MGKYFLTGILLFLFSFFVNSYNFADSGRWQDEKYYAEKGYVIIELLKKGMIQDPYFVTTGADHPITANYFYGALSYLDLSSIGSVKNVAGYNIKQPYFKYDLSAERMLTIFVASLTVLIVFVFCVRFLSYFIAVTSSLILSMLPHFVGYSQKVSLEIFCLFTFSLAAVFCFEYLKSKKIRFAILTGVFSGITLTVKQSNILIFLFLFLIFITHKFIFKDKKLSYRSIFIVTISSMAAIFLTYPMPFIHPFTFVKATYDVWFVNGGRIPELIFGTMAGAPSIYYFIAISITTPVLILFLLFVGIFEILRKKISPLYLSILIWFVVPFFMMFFSARQHMVRYIIEIYAPLAIIASIGLEGVARTFFKKREHYFLLLVPVLIYMAFILIKTSPFYLTYYNELVGGTSRVYKDKLFLVGWYSEGLRGISNYISQKVEKGSVIGYAVNAGFTAINPLDGYMHEVYDPSKEYDYVIVNAFEVTRGGFDEKKLLDKYKVVYEEKGDGYVIATVYKNRLKTFPDQKLIY